MIKKIITFELNLSWILVKKGVFDEFLKNRSLSNFYKIFAIRIMLYSIYKHKVVGKPQEIEITPEIKKLLLSDFKESSEKEKEQIKRELKNKQSTISKSKIIIDFLNRFGIELKTNKHSYPCIKTKSIEEDNINIKINQEIDSEFRKGYRWIYIPTFMLIREADILKALYFKKSRQKNSTNILCKITYGLTMTSLKSVQATGGVLADNNSFQNQTENIIILNPKREHITWYGIKLVSDGQNKKHLETMFFYDSKSKIIQERKYLYFLILRCYFFKKDRYTNFNKDDIITALQKLAKYFKIDHKFLQISIDNVAEYNKKDVLKNLNQAKKALNKQEKEYHNQIQGYIKKCEELPKEITSYLLEKIKKQII